MHARSRMRRCTRTFRLSPSPPGKHALALAVEPFATPQLVRATVREHRSPATRLPPPHGASNGGALLPEHPQLNAETEPPPHLVGVEYNARRRTGSQHWERNFVRRWRFAALREVPKHAPEGSAFA